MRRRLALALVALVAALVAADRLVAARGRDGKIGVYWMPPFGLQSGPAEQALLGDLLERARSGARPGALGSFHPRYGWANQQGAYRLEGERQFINSIGARGQRELDPAPPAGVTRVACFGESFTFGSEVADGEDWPTALDALAEDLEVVNLGVPGWGTDQALLLWRDQHAQLGADVVLIGLLVENIRRNVNRYRPLAYPGENFPNVKPRFRLEGGELVLVPVPYPDRVSWLEAALDGSLRESMRRGDYWDGYDPPLPGSGLAALFAGWRFGRDRDLGRLWMDTEGEPFRVTVALLETFTREVRRSGAWPAVLVFPSQGDLGFRQRGAVYWSALHDALEQRAIPFLDLSGALARTGPPEELFRVHHFTPAANRSVAQEVHTWLAGRGR